MVQPDNQLVIPLIVLAAVFWAWSRLRRTVQQAQQQFLTQLDTQVWRMLSSKAIVI